MRHQSVAKTHQGLVRESNQDSILAMADQPVYAVADGMGGEQAGDEASAQVIATLRSHAELFFRVAPDSPSPVEAMMRETLLASNHDVLAIAARQPEKRGLGSTASMLCLHRGLYFIAHVGDSRVYLVRRGRAKQITRDHTLVWQLYLQGAIRRDQIETHPERHLLTQCIGSLKPIQVDTHTGALEPGDLFMICSDGLTGYAGEEAIYQILLGGQLSLDDQADRLIDAALKAGGGDNVSVILVRIEGLDSEDNWTPEATRPPQLVDASEAETLVDELLKTRPDEASRKQSLRPIIAVLAVLLFLTLAALLIALALRPR